MRLPEAENFRDFMAKTEPSLLFSVPSFYRKLAGVMTDSDKKYLSQIRAFVSAGERLPVPITRFGKILPARRFLIPMAHLKPF